MTEKDMSTALFNVLGALCVRLTGNGAIVGVRNSEGNFDHDFLDDSRVTRVNHLGEIVPLAFDSPVYSGTHCPLHEESSDMPTGPQQSPQLTAIPAD